MSYSPVGKKQGFAWSIILQLKLVTPQGIVLSSFLFQPKLHVKQMGSYGVPLLGCYPAWGKSMLVSAVSYLCCITIFWIPCFSRAWHLTLLLSFFWPFPSFPPKKTNKPNIYLKKKESKPIRPVFCSVLFSVQTYSHLYSRKKSYSTDVTFYTMMMLTSFELGCSLLARLYTTASWHLLCFGQRAYGAVERREPM